MFGFNKLNRATKRRQKAMTVFEEARVELIQANEDYIAAINEEDEKIAKREHEIAESREKQNEAKAGIELNSKMIARLTDFLS